MEKIWYEDVLGFMSNDNYYRVIPIQTMTMEEKLNALVRFFVYLGIILALLRSNYKYLFFGIVAAMTSVALYEYEKNRKIRTEKFLQKHNIDVVDNKVCSRSTVHNPFMNPSVIDIAENPDRPSACLLENDKVHDLVEHNFEANLFRDVSDVYGKMASQRQFYTIPSTTIPNDQEGFAMWLYGTGPSCKEGNGEQCYNNLIEDVQRRPGQQS
jgi:hypothetical protein